MTDRRSLRSRIARQGIVALGTGARMPPERGLSGPTDAPERDLVSKGTSGRGDPLTPVWEAMSEAEFREQHVIPGLRQRSFAVWYVPDSRRLEAGLPDIIALGPLDGRGPLRLLFLELKRQRKRQGRVRPRQQEVIAYLQQVTGVDARIVRPADWPAVLEEIDRLTLGEVDRLLDIRDDLQETVNRLTLDLDTIRELVGAQPGESTLDAVRSMATEWEHYSQEMAQAGHETIPRLIAERDAARALAELEEDASGPE